MCVGGTFSVMVTMVGNGHSEPSSNPGQVCLHFHVVLIPLRKI